MKAHERVGVVPMPARAIAPIDHDDVGLGLGDQRISERHSGGTRSDDEIVGFDRGDGTTPSSVAGQNGYYGGGSNRATTLARCGARSLLSRSRGAVVVICMPT